MNTEEDVRSLFHLWNDALATGDSSIVAQRYTTTDPLLLPTVSDVPRTDFASIKDYFDHFLVKQPKGEIVQGYTKIGDDWCSDAGTYEFTMGTTGDVVKARYSFVYVKEDGEWKIQHHHSSMMPQDKLGHAISKEEVRALFNLWNDALATGDPKQVAARYGKEAALLPTVSDVPRNDAAGIEDYFVHFLKNEPQGEILQGEIVIGTNWAQDSGIYEFTMGTTGAKVKGRYSYIYVYENDEWMISHHHSSVMPEGNIPKAITEQEVKDLFQIWNTALATEDPDSVAKCYSKNAVLLPTVSDKPRTDYELIKDYFVHFLQKKPSGTILESYVTIGHNYCQDVGIYEFALAATGDKVKGRYSFVYVWEDGAWKISHHHSSMMPEAFL